MVLNKKIVFILFVFSSLLLTGCESNKQPQKVITSTFTQECKTCDDESSCPSACDSACVSGGGDGQEGSTGYTDSEYLGLKKTTTCTCRCYDWQ